MNVVVLLVVSISALILFLYRKKILKALSKNQTDSYCERGNGYKTLNMTSGGEAPWKCSGCASYGSLFDYRAKLHDQTYGVHNGCQRIF